MRFGKKLAITIQESSNEVPYMSHKQMKSVLIKIEKLFKAFEQQQACLVPLNFDQRISSPVVDHSMGNYAYNHVSFDDLLGADKEFFDLVENDTRLGVLCGDK